jgi:hypothetical protein
MGLISKQDFKLNGKRLNDIDDSDFPLDYLEYSIQQDLSNSLFTELNFKSVDKIFDSMEIVVRKNFVKELKENKIKCFLRVVETGNDDVEEIEGVNFKFIVVGRDLKKNFEKSRYDFRKSVFEMTGGEYRSFLLSIPDKISLIIQVLPIQFPSNIINYRRNLGFSQKKFFSEEFVEYVLNNPVIYQETQF